MAERQVVAQVTVDGEGRVGKRTVDSYDGSSKATDQMVADANVGLTLRVQQSIRNALKAKYGEGRPAKARPELVNAEEV